MAFTGPSELSRLVLPGDPMVDTVVDGSLWLGWGRGTKMYINSRILMLQGERNRWCKSGGKYGDIHLVDSSAPSCDYTT